MSLAEASIKSMLSRAVAFHDFVGATGTSGEKIAYALTRIHNGTVAEPLNEDHFDEAERNAIYPMALICTTGYQMVHLSTGTINEYTLAGEIMVCLISFDDPLLTSSENYITGTNQWQAIWEDVCEFAGPGTDGTTLNINNVNLIEFCQTKIEDLAGLGERNPDFIHKINARLESKWSISWSNGEP